MGQLIDGIRLDLSLIPGFFIRALAAPFMIGAAKYARGDWRSAIKNREEAQEAINRRTTSLLNHLAEHQDGTFYDDEGFAHLAAVAWNALYILWIQNTFFEIPPIFGHALDRTIKGHLEAKQGGK
ncbi:MAG TPA: dATP/dGTP diphosphohydrolase domain-containing protein [Dongiaceae bacterium]|nr:dATP/dGTP diphosphohydrolase domain-containing protein [Dongiaceae bacterium]